MKLKRLFKEIEGAKIRGAKDPEINGICSNSKLVAPGNLFIARKGLVDDGANYIAEAVAAGAAAVVTDMYDPSLKDVTQVIYEKAGEIEGKLAAEYYQYPSDDLFMVGITGTNGKTTTSFLTKFLLDKLGSPAGLIGTIEYIIGAQRYKAVRTTPDVVTNHKMLREMCLKGCRSAVMEVTSHALDQGRVREIHYDVAVFTNLTLDHLDYHETMENYCAAKNRLFRDLGKAKVDKRKKWPPTAIVNGDSPWASKITEGAATRKITYGLSEGVDLQAAKLTLTSRGTQLLMKFQGQELPCSTPLVGRFNVYNSLAAIGVALAAGYPLEKILPMLASCPSVPGRLEPVQNPLSLKIYVDFAHSDDALENVLESLSEFKQGKMITVFGCGGDRDFLKRPKMAAVAERYSDVTIVTSDNPRTEDPKEIAAQITRGFKSSASYRVELDRQRAIALALQLAKPEDIVLIAGKGHETTQIFAHKTIEFDDRKVARQIAEEYAKI